MTPEELRNQPKCPPVVESYEGSPAVVGKDGTEPERGMRVRMAQGYISHGVGTIVEVGEAGTDAEGTCRVIWDSDACHTRPLHSRLGNLHVARVGRAGEHHLVLADTVVCDDLHVKAHRIVEGGLARTHLEVVRACALPMEVRAGEGAQEAGKEHGL